MPDQIIFDPDVVQAFRNQIAEQLDRLQNAVIPTLCDGEVLAVEPAFGRFPEGQRQLSEYQRHFAGIWGDIQRLKSALQAIDDACRTTMDNYSTTDDTTAQGLSTMAEQTDPDFGRTGGAPAAGDRTAV